MLQTGISHLNAVLLTHEHNDHIIGVDDVRPFYFRQNEDIPFYASQRVQEELKTRFGYIFAKEKYPGVPSLFLHTISKEENFQVEGISIIPIEVLHGQLPILGYRFGDFTYLTDIFTISSEELEKVKGTKVLLISALHYQEHYSHINVPQALALIEQIQPEQAFITHVSHRMGLAKDVNPTLPSNVQLAYDMQEILVGG